MTEKKAIIPPILTSISGDSKSGKSHLASSWPDPILVFSFDLGLDRVLPKFASKKIDVITYPIPVIDSDPPKPYAKAIWEKFDKDYQAALASGKYQTIIIDTATGLWEIIRHAIAEEKGQQRLLEVQYTLPNLRMQSIFTRAKLAEVNLVTTQYLRDRYVNEKNTGEEEQDGWKRTDSRVDVVLWVRMEQRPAPAGKKNNVVVTQIKGNWFDRNLNGQEFIDLTYSDLVSILGID